MSGIISKAAESRKEAPVTAVTQQKKPQTLQEYINRQKAEVARALPKNLDPDQFVRVAMTAANSNPKFTQCNVRSFLGAMMTAAQIGIMPNTPLQLGYLIPRYNGKTQQNDVTFQLGYRGMIDLAYRSGNITNVAAHVVYKNDEFHVQYGLNPDITHVPCLTDKGDPVAFYAYYKTKDGGFGFDVMSIEEVHAHRNQYSPASKSGGSSPWDTAFESMALKTVLKRALKYAPLSVEVANAVRVEGALREDATTAIEEAEVTYVNIDAETGEVLTDEEAGK